MKCSVCRTAPRRMRSKRPTGSLRGNTIPIITPTIRLRIWHQEKMKEINEAYATLMKGGRQQADAREHRWPAQQCGKHVVAAL